MDKKKIMYAVMLTMLIIGIPIALAVVYFPGLPSIVATAVTGAGCTYIAVGAAVVAGGYLVYHAAKTTWKYYKASSYDVVSDHALIHKSDFPNIWKTTPSSTAFKKRCMDNMNKGSNAKYYNLFDTGNGAGRLLSYSQADEMLTVGEKDGKTVVTCYRMKLNEVLNKIATGKWITAKKY